MNKQIGIKAGQYVVFSIKDKRCALPIDEVIEIIRLQSITYVPGVKEYIPGMINLRGKIIPVVNLHQRYQIPKTPPTKKTRLIIVRSEGEDIGLIVDEVAMVTEVQKEEIEPTLDMFNSLEKGCYLGFAKVAEQLIGILNIHKVLYPDHEGVLQVE